jgi:predicted RNA-binding protein YlxR (DUF448 family)
MLNHFYIGEKMADPNQTPARGEWVCPCTGCSKARKKAFKEVLALLEDRDMAYAWHQAYMYINSELKKK